MVTAKDAPDIAFFPPFAALAAPLLAILLEWLLPLRLLAPPGAIGQLVLGVALLLVAAGLAIGGARAFRAAGTNVNPRQPALIIVTDGPYRFTRNPMYLGMVVLQLGLALTFSLDWELLIAPVLWLALHFGVVLREEAYLASKFGADYTAFRNGTRRWL